MVPAIRSPSRLPCGLTSIIHRLTTQVTGGINRPGPPRGARTRRRARGGPNRVGAPVAPPNAPPSGGLPERPPAGERLQHRRVPDEHRRHEHHQGGGDQRGVGDPHGEARAEDEQEEQVQDEGQADLRQDVDEQGQGPGTEPGDPDVELHRLAADEAVDGGGPVRSHRFILGSPPWTSTPTWPSTRASGAGWRTWPGGGSWARKRRTEWAPRTRAPPPTPPWS